MCRTGWSAYRFRWSRRWSIHLASEGRPFDDDASRPRRGGGDVRVERLGRARERVQKWRVFIVGIAS